SRALQGPAPPAASWPGAGGAGQVCLALRELDRERLRRLIDTHATGRSGVIDRHELPELLVKCGVVADDVVRSWEVAAEIEDAGSQLEVQRARCHRPLVARGRGHFEPEDAARSAAQRELERQYMVAVGWSAERVAECRRAFEQFDESMGDVLTESELLKPRRARGRYAPLVRDLDVAFLALSLDTSVEVRVDFLTFMRIMKMLDESEARRGMAGMLGFGDESSDRIIGIYQKLSDQHGFSAAGLPRSVVEQASRPSGSAAVDPEGAADRTADPPELRASDRGLRGPPEVHEGAAGDARWRVLRGVLGGPPAGRGHGALGPARADQAGVHAEGRGPPAARRGPARGGAVRAAG
ncbi:unnamed protein product, partial [Prorocentrum cordatum]